MTGRTHITRVLRRSVFAACAGAVVAVVGLIWTLVGDPETGLLISGVNGIANALLGFWLVGYTSALKQFDAWLTSTIDAAGMGAAGTPTRLSEATPALLDRIERAAATRPTILSPTVIAAGIAATGSVLTAGIALLAVLLS